MGVASRETCTVCEQYSQHSINSPVTGDRNKCYALRQGRFTDFVVVWNVSFLWFGGYSESSFTAFRLLPFSDGRALFIDLYWCFSPDTLSLDNCPWSLSAIYPMGGPESKKKSRITGISPSRPFVSFPDASLLSNLHHCFCYIRHRPKVVRLDVKETFEHFFSLQSGVRYYWPVHPPKEPAGRSQTFIPYYYYYYYYYYYHYYY